VAVVIECKLPSRSPMLGFQPPAGVDLVPVFPPVYRAILPPHYRKAWLEKRVPDYKVYLNNTLALETTWIGPEEMGIFQRQEKPRLMTNQAAMSISRPVAASRNFHTLLLTPRRISGRSGGGLPFQSPVPLAWPMAVSAATLMAMESDVTQGPSASSAHPLHLLSLAPIKIPLLTPPSTGKNSFLFLIYFLFLPYPSNNRPVASTPVPGSPWCVVWTGDDRVFFFNPTMQLSVWEKPLDLQDRGDLNKIIEDPPHKRKKDTLPEDEDDEEEDNHISKSKRNNTDGHAERCRAAPDQPVLPLELRVTHFRDMLLERGVSAFSTWEKELHKIVFDPRYLLLGPEERKQIFDQFVKARINEEYKERKNKLQQAKEEFRKLLEESKVTSRSTFKEFSEKYGREPRFKQVPKQKDRELLFIQFVNGLKKRDKENRMKLRKMR
uniref:Transcription elongation regulator 1-like protein n=1 Tax=Electrophorus electricus TaxID=8005 RepID=A0A4W4EBG4_ELEEL